jgi:hypothetical protein
MSEENTHAPAVGNRMLPALMFRDDLATGTFATKSLPDGTDRKVKCYNKWNLKCTLNINGNKKSEKQRMLVYVWPKTDCNEEFMNQLIN